MLTRFRVEYKSNRTDSGRKTRIMNYSRPKKRACTLIMLALVSLVLLMMQPATHSHADGPVLLWLPLVLSNAPATVPLAGTLREQIALDHINAYRALAGVQRVAPHPALLAAAQHHADYDLRNHGDPAAWTNGPHGEVAGKPGFSGIMPGERAAAAGYAWAARLGSDRLL